MRSNTASSLVLHVGQTALSAVVSVEVLGHKYTRSAFVLWALLAGSLDFSVIINFVELQYGKLNSLVLVLDLLWLGVVLLLSFLTSTTKTQYQVQSCLLLDVVVTQCAAIFQLFSGEDQTLLIRWDTFLVLDLLLYILDGITGLYIECDGLTRQSFYENLHLILLMG